MEEPPALSVVNADAKIEALKGGFSWQYKDWKGETVAVITDSAHPLQCKDITPILEMTQTPLSSVDPRLAYLQWETKPDKVTVRCWSDECWDNVEASSENIRAEMLEEDYVIQLKKGNYIYEVCAEWDNGTSYYSFYAVKSPIENDVDYVRGKSEWGVTLSVENVTSTSATIKCVQSGGAPTGELQTGSAYVIEQWTEEGWKQAPYYAEVCWTAEAWMIPLNDTCEWDVEWEWLYGELPAGKYRIGKEIMDFRGTADYDQERVFAEFEIK